MTGEILVDEKGKPTVIHLWGRDSEKYRSEMRKRQNKRLSTASKRNQQSLNIEQIESDSLEVLVAATAGWDNVVWEGQKLDPTPENIRKVYKSLPWLMDQVDQFVNTRENFFQN